MNLLEKLDALKAAKGDTNASLARNAGIPVTTIYGLYQKGYSNMKLSTLESLCKYFGVSLDYLAKDDSENASAASDHTENDSLIEVELVDIYRRLNIHGRDMLISTARSYAKDPEMKRGGASTTETA